MLAIEIKPQNPLSVTVMTAHVHFYKYKTISSLPAAIGLTGLTYDAVIWKKRICRLHYPGLPHLRK